MKKLISFILILLLFGFSCLTTTKIKAQENTITGLGHPINAVKSDYYGGVLSIKDGCEVLEHNFLKAQNEIKKEQLDYIEHNITVRGLDKFQQSLAHLNSFKVEDSMVFTSYKFFLRKEFLQEEYNYYYIARMREFHKHTLELENYSANISLYKNNLSISYINDLENIKNGTLIYQDFFEKWGTHLVTKAIYGGAQIGYGYSQDIISDDDYILNFYEGPYKQYSIMGGAFIGAENYIKWVNSVNDDTVALISMPQDGLIALWELIPDEYLELIEPMKKAFNDYANKHYNEAAAEMELVSLYNLKEEERIKQQEEILYKIKLETSLLTNTKWTLIIISCGLVIIGIFVFLSLNFVYKKKHKPT